MRVRKQKVAQQALRISAGVGALALALSACAPGGAESENTETEASDSANNEEAQGEDAEKVIKVGFLSPVTGTVAAAGTEMREGWDLYWEKHDGRVGDVVIETYYEDDAGDPDTALTKAKRLVEDENVDILVGPLLANTGLAVSDYAIQVGIPNLHPVSAADDLTQRLANPLIMRAGSYTGSQMNFAGGEWAYDQGHKTAVTFCPDYAFGWESCGGFVRAFVDAGGEITDQLWYPLGTQDFSTYVSQIGSADADIVFIATAGGADGPNFFRTYSDFGLLGDQPLLTNCCAIDQSTLRDIGDMALDIASVSYWAEGRDDPVVQEFVEMYEDQYGMIPSLNVAGSYVTAQVFAAALEETDGVVDGEDFVAVIQSLELPDSLYGPLKYDEYNNPVGPVYIRHVADRGDGALWNVVDEVIDDVSQFWTYDPEEYLEDPPYSRDFTGE